MPNKAIEIVGLMEKEEVRPLGHHRGHVMGISKKKELDVTALLWNDLI